MSARSLPALATALMVGLPTLAWAQLWSPSTGVPVCGDSCVGDNHHVTGDGVGGLYVAWRELRDYPTTGYDVYLQRITVEGEVATGWPVAGLSVCALPGDQSVGAVAPDGEGGVFAAWYEARGGSGWDVYVQRVRADGSLYAGWPVNGVPASRAGYGQFPQAIVADGQGGAYVMWEDERFLPTQNYDVYAQHLTGSGAIAAGWPVDGLPVCAAMNYQHGIQALQDGAGGVVSAWNDLRRYYAPEYRIETYAQRLRTDGMIANGWVADGSLIASSRGTPRIAPDGGGGFYVVSSTYAYSAAVAEHWVDRFTMSGTRAVGWPTEGVLVCGAPNVRQPPSVSSDGLSGLLLAWSDSRGPTSTEIFASRVLPDGTIAPGWASNGVQISLLTEGYSSVPEVVADGMGGAYVCWEWHDSSTPSTYSSVQHVTAQGAVAPGWPPGGVRVATSQSQFGPHAVMDGSGGVIVLWRRVGLYAQRFAGDGPTPVLLANATANVTPDRVSLRWLGPGASSLAASVYRRESASDWERLGAASPDGADALAYEDRVVKAGARYGYRLGYAEDGSEQFTHETWVDVPLAARVALRGLYPNPSAGDPAVAFSLVSNEPASLSMYDLRGRLVFACEVGDLGAGEHRIPVGGRGRVPAGIYAIRLRQGEFTATARAVVIR